MRRIVTLSLLMMLPAMPLRADIDESAYEAVGAVRSEAERRRMQSEFAKQIETERQRRAATEAAQQQARAAALAREAARPYPERLTEQQCTLCHPAENYTSKHHTWLYWRLVIARMVWLNDAPIPADVQAIIANHLAAAHPARGEDIITEYGIPAAVLTLLAGMAWTGRRLWKGRH